MTPLQHDPYGACARCEMQRPAAEGQRVCAHPNAGGQAIEQARSKFGPCGPEANLAVADWARPQ